MADKKAFVQLDKVKKTAHYESIVVAEDAGLKAGQFVDLGVIDENVDGGEIFTYTKSAVGKTYDGLFVPIHLDYGWHGFDEALQTIAKGKAGRVLIPEKGDIVSFHEDLVTGSVAIGDGVAVGTAGLGIAKAAGEAEVIGKVVAERYIANIGDVVVVRFA